MKSSLKCLSIAILIALSIPAYAQLEYKVTYIQGIITIKDTKLKVGDIFLSTDKIDFKNSDAIVKVCCSGEGKPVIFYGANVEKSGSKSLKENQQYLSSLGSSRGATKEMDINDFKSFLATPILGIIDTLRIPINTQEYPINDASYFYLRFNYNGEEINKRLSVENDAVLISNYIFNLPNIGDIQPSSLPVLFYYHNALLEQSTLITSDFYPVFIDSSQLKQGLAPVLYNTEILQEDKIKLISDYLKLEYTYVSFTEDSILNFLPGK
ncbi:MAG: hypothetical protein WBA61_16985 [Aequorivita sp.]